MTMPRLNAGHAIIAALLLATVLLTVRAAGAFNVEPPAVPPFSPPQMTDRALLAARDPFFPEGAVDGEALPVTAQPFSLHGLRAETATGQGSAIISTGTGQQGLFAIGDTLAPGVTLAAIAIDHVVIESNGRREALWLDAGGDAPVERFAPPGLEQDPDLPPSDAEPEGHSHSDPEESARRSSVPGHAPIPEDDLDAGAPTDAQLPAPTRQAEPNE